jgi:ribosomal-protein-alanine acetyltransferase
MNVILRPAHAGDLPALVQLEAACFADAWSEASLRAEIEAPYGRCYVALAGGMVVGAFLGWNVGQEWSVVRVAVPPELRRNGIGRLLMRHALDRARGEACTRALLEVRTDNEPAIALYEAQGFRRAGVRPDYYPDGADALVMELALPPRALAHGVYALVDADRLRAPHDVAGVERLVSYAESAVQAGAVAVQLRWKSLALGDPLRADALRSMAEAVEERVPVIVDDAVAAAVACGDLAGIGVHLGQHDADPVAARLQLGDAAWIGWSTHDLDQLAHGDELPVDYLGFGPVRATATKAPHDPEVGIDGLTLAVRQARLPVVAIGGLDRGDLRAVKAAGARAAAVVTAWLGPAAAPLRADEAGAALAGLVDAWEAD